jgi:hypothetical protein
MKLLTSLLLGGLALPTLFAACECEPWCTCGHGPGGPISLMGEHTHDAGEWMVSYRYMFMDMDGMYRGSSSTSAGDVFAAGYVVTPEWMTMDMHMLGLMYAPTDDLTLMAMLPYTQMEMSHQIDPAAGMLVMLNGGSRSFTTSTSGIGDLRLSGLIDLVERGPHHLHGGFGFSLPTGSIAERDIVPGPGGRLQRQLPAAMQLGSGTFDLLPSLTYRYHGRSWSAGVQAAGIYRTQDNWHGYRFGHRFDLNTWVSWFPCAWMSVSGGLAYRWEGELSGRQEDVMTRPPFAPARLTVPTAFGENYGGQQLEALIGMNVMIPKGPLENHRLAIDLRLPLWQRVQGDRLGVDYTLTTGWRYAF